MLRSVLALFTFLSAICTAFAQKGLPGVGKVDKADLDMTDCSFDKGADAVKLIDWGNLYYDRGTAGISLFKTIYEKRVRIKVLKEKGLSEANVTIPYYSYDNDEVIRGLDAYSYNLDEAGNIKTTEVKKSSIYTKKINAYYSEMIIAFPDVKVGSIIEYKYKIESENFGNIKDWYFQDNIPTRYSEYQINVPTIFRFTVQPSVVDSIEIKEDVSDGSINVNDGAILTKILKKNFIMRNLIGIRNEPFMGSAKDYQQRLEFQLSQIDYGNGEIRDLRVKWSNVVEDLMKNENFGKQLEKTLNGTEGIIAQAKNLDPENRVKFLFNTVRKTINWNGDEDKYTDNGISATWDTKNGNAADINLLLVKLLTDAGVRASPILFSTRDNGLVNTFYPFTSQFNIVMVCVPLNGKNYILDATDRISNYKLTPEKIVNTKGFIVDGGSGRWIDVVDVTHKYKVMSAMHGDIAADGTMKGDGLVNCKDYARKHRCEVWMKDKDKFKKDYFTVTGVPITIDELTVNNADADSLQLEQKVKFSSSLNSSGDYRYFNVNLFSDLDKNPFIQDERITDIDFGFTQEYTLFGNYTIPEGYVFDELPQNISMIMPDSSIVFSRTMQADNNLLNVRMSVEFLRTYYPASQYPEFKEFYKKLFISLNEQIVIKKKP